MYACSSSTLQCNVYSYFIILTEKIRVFFLSHMSRSGDLFAIDLHSSSQCVRLGFELLLENYRSIVQNSSFILPHLKKIEWHSYDNHKTFSQNFEIHGSYNKGSDLSQGHICRMMKMYVILENLFLKSHI